MLIAFLGGCETSKPNPTDLARERAIESMDRTAARIQLLDDAIRLVQRRRTIEFAVPGDSYSDPVPPSLVLDRLVRGADPETALFAQLLRGAEANEPLPTLLVSTECLSTRGIRRDPPASVPPTWRFLAKALDTVALVQTIPCPASTEGIEIKSPYASWRRSKDLLGVIAREEEEHRRESDRPFVISDADLPAVMVGQGYRFADKSDKDVLVPDYVAVRFQIATEGIKTMLLPLSTGAGKVTIFFDRTRTSGGQDLMGPLGWFAAHAASGSGAIYVSPTLARAAFIACGQKVPFDTTWPDRIRQLRDLFETRQATSNDVLAVTASMADVVDQFDRCMDGKVDFLLGHELAHSLLQIAVEARADCVGRAVATARGNASGGIFDSLIFGLVDREDQFLLGVLQPDDKRRLTCRAKLHREARPDIQTSFESAVNKCREMPKICE